MGGHHAHHAAAHVLTRNPALYWHALAWLLPPSAGLGEFKIRDLNDDINKKMREKRHWEDRIRSVDDPHPTPLRRRGVPMVGSGTGVPTEAHYCLGPDCSSTPRHSSTSSGTPSPLLWIYPTPPCNRQRPRAPRVPHRGHRGRRPTCILGRCCIPPPISDFVVLRTFYFNRSHYSLMGRSLRQGSWGAKLPENGAKDA